MEDKTQHTGKTSGQPETKKTGKSSDNSEKTFKFMTEISSGSPPKFLCPICEDGLLEKCTHCRDKQDEVCCPAGGKCKHVFHFHCIREWLKTNQVCPVCNIKWEFDKLPVGN